MKKIITILILVQISQFSVIAQTNSNHKSSFFTDKDGLAIGGYDPVSYILFNKGEKGKASLSFIYKGATFHFSSESNLQTFKAKPEKYEPAYGGFCAYAMGSYGEKVEVDPATFKIINGRTYLFYNFYFNNTLKDWNKDEANLLKNGNANWEKFNSQK
jgi:YHS domain-containing protein